jgi:hypothetical protein
MAFLWHSLAFRQSVRPGWLLRDVLEQRILLC